MNNNAPTVTIEHLNGLIDFEHYFTAYEGVIGEQVHHDKGESPELPVKIQDSLRLMTFCILVLKNGFTVVGQSACASPERYNKEIGQKIARENAIQQLWQIIGYELKTKLATIGKVSDRDLGESLTHMTAIAFIGSEPFSISDADRILAHFESKASEEKDQEKVDEHFGVEHVQDPKATAAQPFGDDA